MSSGSAPGQVIAMCQALELTPGDTLTVLGMVRELDAGVHDGQLATPDEPAAPPKTSGGKIGDQPEPLEQEEFLGDPPAVGDETLPGDQGAEDVAEAAFDHLADRGAFGPLFEQLRAPRLTHLEFLDSIGCRASDLLPASDLDTIGRELCGRPFFSCPRYFRGLFDYAATARMWQRYQVQMIAETMGSM